MMFLFNKRIHAEYADGWRIEIIHADDSGWTRMRYASADVRLDLTRMEKSVSLRLFSASGIRVFSVLPFVKLNLSKWKNPRPVKGLT